MLLETSIDDAKVAGSFRLSAPITAIACSQNCRNTLLVGLIDNSIRLVDLRSQQDGMVKSTFKSHTNIASCLQMDPLQPDYNFISASYDKSLKLWDIRSPNVPIHDIVDHSSRVLCIEACNSFLASGAADSNLNFYKRS